MKQLSVLVLLFGIFVGFIVVSNSQLVTPFQICEMQQMKLRNLTGSVSYDNLEMKEIRDYCFKHAYDHIGNLGTLG